VGVVSANPSTFDGWRGGGGCVFYLLSLICGVGCRVSDPQIEALFAIHYCATKGTLNRHQGRQHTPAVALGSARRQVSGVGCRVSGVRCQVSGVGCRVGVRYHVSGVGVRYHVSGVGA
jgi:hypothetical protein